MIMTVTSFSQNQRQPSLWTNTLLFFSPFVFAYWILSSTHSIRIRSAGLRPQDGTVRYNGQENNIHNNKTLQFWKETKRDLHSSVVYAVKLYLQLKYLNNTLAVELEKRDPQNPAIIHFCKMVNYQASGKQVQLVSSEKGVTIETVQKNDADNGALAYQCTIAATNRVYDNEGEDFLGEGFFILEVAVEQYVHVTTANADAAPNNLEQITNMVLTGFERGIGGHAKFRSLLWENDAFETILDVAVLENNNLSAPQTAPTQKPSIFLTQHPPLTVHKPSAAPSSPPTGSPSMLPSSIPSTSPSITLTSRPSKAPTKVPTSLPSSLPSPVSSPQKDQLGLIIGAIVGGTFTLLVSCMFIINLWLPSYCPPKEGDHQAITERQSSNRKRRQSICLGGNQSEGYSHSRRNTSLIPGIVQLDNDAQSLANTSLGDPTAGQLVVLGRMASTHNGSPLLEKKEEATKELDGILMFDSFDENSLYTSPNKVASTVHDMNIVATPQVDAKPDVAKPDVRKIKFLPTNMTLPPYLSSQFGMEEENKEDIASPPPKLADYDRTPTCPSLSINSRNKQSQSTSIYEPTHVDTEKGLHSFGDGDSQIQGTSTGGDGNIAEAASHSMDLGRKDCVLSDEDSSNASYGFENLEECNNSANPCLSKLDDDGEGCNRSPPPSTSRQTKKVGHDLPRCPLEPGDFKGQRDSVETFENEKHEADYKIRDSPRFPGSPVVTRRSTSGTCRHIERNHHYDTTSNNSLLRYVLEEARILSDAKISSSSRSRASRTSAPARIPSEYQDRKASQRRGAEFPLDPVVAPQFNLKESVPPFPSSRSVDAARPSTANQNELKVIKTKSTQFYTSRYVDDSSPSNSGDLPEDPLNAKKFSSPEIGVDSPGSTRSTNSAKKLGEDVPTPLEPTLGAKPRDDQWGTETDEDGNFADTPESSPGMLGIADQRHDGDLQLFEDRSTESEGLSNPWLFTWTEQTSEPPSSRKSYQQENPKFTTSNCSSETYGKTTSPTSISSSEASIINESTGSPSEAILPRTLEDDLKSLDLRLANGPRRISRATEMLPGRVVKRGKKKRVTVVVPPGKLGVVLANRPDGKGIVVSEVRPSSSMKGMVSPGDKLVAVDGEDVTKMEISDITLLMSSRSEQQRQLTVITELKKAQDKA